MAWPTLNPYARLPSQLPRASDSSAATASGSPRSGLLSPFVLFPLPFWFPFFNEIRARNENTGRRLDAIRSPMRSRARQMPYFSVWMRSGRTRCSPSTAVASAHRVEVIDASALRIGQQIEMPIGVQNNSCQLPISSNMIPRGHE